MKIERFPNIKLISFHAAFLNKAILLATRHFLRAADSLYLTAARESKATLITLDEEMLRRSGTAASVSTPAMWLSDHVPNS